jgi:NAD(P)-dependent dehydrogenase (short-subunit alcohol dehydrogenase family)
VAATSRWTSPTPLRRPRRWTRRATSTRSSWPRATSRSAAPRAPDEIARALFDVNLVGPIALIRAALAAPEPPRAIVALSAIVADLPTAQMAAYSAAKAGLSAYLTALRHERRKARTTVLDVRPPHLDTGFETRALAGEPPRLPEPVPAAELVPRIVDAVREGRRALAWDAANRQFVTA